MRLKVGYWTPQQPVVLEATLRNPKTGRMLPKTTLILDTGFRGLEAVAITMNARKELGLGIIGSTDVRLAFGYGNPLEAEGVIVEVAGRSVNSMVIIAELEPGFISLDLASRLFDSIEIDFRSGEVWGKIEETSK